MKYPMVNSWVSCQKTDSEYWLFDELHGIRYKISKRIFDLLKELDGATDPYKTEAGFNQEEMDEILQKLEEEQLIRKGSILEQSFGMIAVTLLTVRGGRIKKFSKKIDQICSVLWLPVVLSSILYLLNHTSDMRGNDCILSGMIFGMITGMALHEIGHAAACIHYGGKVFEFGAGIAFLFPFAFVLLNTDDIESRKKRVHVNAAGIEMNLFLAGLSFYLACFLSFAGGFLFFAGISNVILALLNFPFIRSNKVSL